jgi:hypothetical protein
MPMSEEDDAKDISLNAGTRIEIHFIKGNLFRVVHVDGVWGGVTPQLDLQMAFFSERTPIPRTIIQELGSDSAFHEVGREGKAGIVREVEVEAVMSLDVARSVAQWLQEKITQLEKVKAQAAMEDSENLHG